jgi:prepilin-type N-terminal cleavage/methylation domain-containing protein
MAPAAARARLADERGFTLPELLVAMVLFGILSAAFAMVISATVRHSAVITNESVLQTQTRVALNQIVKDLREATLSTTAGTSPFVAVGGVMSSSTVTFYAPDSTYATATPTTYHLREISYRVSGGQLQRATSVSSNTNGPPWTIPALGSWVPLVDGVVNTAAFAYYDGSQPPALTNSPAAVRTVVVTLTLSVKGTPVQYTYSSSATLRETPPS